MRNARAHKLQWSDPTVHSSTVVRTKANSKENSFCFVFVNPGEKFILCYFSYAYVASENQAKGLFV